MGPEKRHVVLAAMTLPAIAACSLFVDLSDLTAGDAAVSDAGGDALTDVFAGSEASTIHDAGDAGAIETDAAWTFVGTNGVQGQTLSLSNVQSGDLVVIGCDMPSTASTVTFSGFDSIVLSPSVIGPNAPNSLQTNIAWGIIGDTPDGGTLTVTAQPSGTFAFIDCSINNYRGGTPKASLVGSKSNGATGNGLVSCGPVASARGGVGYYIAVRYTCAGLPTSPFTQRQDLEGNPNGDAVPTDGSMLQTQLADCSASTGDWVCTTIAISP